MRNRIRQISLKIILKIWQLFNSSKGNVHLSSREAKLKRIPFSNFRVYMRPTTSDVGRVGELQHQIYVSPSYLHDLVNGSGPNVLIDAGANIGLATLGMVKNFPSLQMVVGVEAQKDNYEILEKNYRLFSDQFPNISFIALHGAIASTENGFLYPETSLAELTQTNSASGTFRFSEDRSDDNVRGVRTVTVTSILSASKYKKLLIKIDIEGGEHNLFASNTQWLKDTHFLTMEIHDRFHPNLVTSSKNFLSAINEHDFAIVPEKDVVHLYNREKLKI